MGDKRLLSLVYTYIPDDPRVIGQARTAAAAGYRVDAIGIALYNGRAGYQTIDSVNIITVPVAHKLKHVLPNVWWLVRGKVPEQPVSPDAPLPSSALSLLFFFLWILRLTLFKRCDIIHAHEHQTMPIAWLQATFKRCRWVYDAHEHVPGNRRIISTVKARIAVRTERFFLRRADAVVTVGERLAQDLRQRGARRVVIIGNWKETARFTADEAVLAEKRAEHALERYKLVVSYFGVLNEERQTDVLLEAVTQTPDVALLLSGRGALYEQAKALAAQHDNMIWLDWLPYEQVPLYTLLCDVVYACLKEVSGNPEYMAPNKLFDAFAAGKALIARRGLGEIGVILEQEGAAILLDEVTAETVCGAFEQLMQPECLQALQANARAASLRYNWDVARERLLALYSALTETDVL